LNENDWNVTEADRNVEQIFKAVPAVSMIVLSYDSVVLHLLLGSMFSELTTFRRREMIGKFANDDLYFEADKVLVVVIRFVY
jgi:hypothetical protein